MFENFLVILLSSFCSTPFVDPTPTATPSARSINTCFMFYLCIATPQVCNHPDLFEARQIDSPFVLPPLDLGVGTQVLRSRSSSSSLPSSSWVPPCGFPARFGGVLFDAATAAAAATGDGAATAGGKLDSGEDGDGEKAGAGAGSRRSPDGGVSRSLIAPLWAHDLRGDSLGLCTVDVVLLLLLCYSCCCCVPLLFLFLL